MNWLITGGCGFIGRNLVKSLRAEKGHRIRIIDNLSVGSKEELEAVCSFHVVDEPAGLEESRPQLIVGDILDEFFALKAAEGIDTIVHLAANTGVGPSVENPRMDCLSNVIGTFNYLEAARCAGVPRFIFASSGAPAGEVEPPIHEELAPHPVSPYGASKLAGEGYCSAYYRTFGIETVALRFSNVYGPLSTKKSSVVAKFIRQILQGKELVIYGDGSQTRDFIYIDDLARAIEAAAVKPGIGGEIFQIATARETSVEEVAAQIIRVFGANEQKRKITISHTNARLGDVKRNFSDTTKAERMLGWKAEVKLAVGLERTIEWFQSQA